MRLSAMIVVSGLALSVSGTVAAAGSDRPAGCIPARPILEELREENPGILVLQDEEAQRWITAFNALPPATEFRADRLILEDGPSEQFVWLLRDGFLCERIAVDERAAELVLTFARGQPI